MNWNTNRRRRGLRSWYSIKSSIKCNPNSHIIGFPNAGPNNIPFQWKYLLIRWGVISLIILESCATCRDRRVASSIRPSKKIWGNCWKGSLYLSVLHDNNIRFDNWESKLLDISKTGFSLVWMFHCLSPSGANSLQNTSLSSSFRPILCL